MSVKPVIDQFKALAHPLRYAILEELGARERNVSEIEQATGIGQPTLSQQLAVLRKSGLVQTRRAAKLVYYRIAPEQITGLAQALNALAGLDPSAPVERRIPSPGAANFARLS
ncbi:MAG: transcriptional regulator [Erythrobacter sp. RIFCSPHIGHO2_12_FULL_63_10]|nr:MAG: transcriptional regulator [Erythrobacter sp. RIFCSPHIGHO2_12_FULL_63_10]